MVMFDDPRLTTRSSDVVLANKDDLTTVQTLGHYAELLADAVVSAPVFGVSKRVIFLRHQGRSLPLLNPVLLEARDFSFRTESCWPSLQDIKMRANRPKYISFKAMSLDGNSQDVQVSGDTAQSLHSHLELLDGGSPALKMTQFQLFQALRLQYFKEAGWPLRLSNQLLGMSDRSTAENNDDNVFDGQWNLTVKAAIKLPTQPEKFVIDLRDPFACLSATDFAILRSYCVLRHGIRLGLFQVANPFLALAVNLVAQPDSIITASDLSGRDVLMRLFEESAQRKIPVVTGKITDLEYRQKPDAFFLDWCWSEGEDATFEADIRTISKKLTASGMVYLAVPEHLGKLELSRSIFTKIFPRVSSGTSDHVDFVIGMRSASAPALGEAQLIHNLNPFPWRSN